MRRWPDLERDTEAVAAEAAAAAAAAAVVVVVAADDVEGDRAWF
jgi:hypothetical protein